MTGNLSNKLVIKLILVFLGLVLLMGIAYILIGYKFTDRYFEESYQQLNAQLANHLIEEKFKDQSPFNEDGSVNKALFGDIMHDMMAVNRGIEVYLTDSLGQILYSVVLDHDQSKEPQESVDTEPIRQFIASKGSKYILGDDPRGKAQEKIFSAAGFHYENTKYFIYIVLKGREFEEAADRLFGSFFARIGLGGILLTTLFVVLIGIISILFLTRNLNRVIAVVKRFREGDYKIRIEEPEKSDLSVLAVTFNEMADTLEANIEQIKSVDTLRRELIANVSHDLRTPLSILRGYIETLQIKGNTLTHEENDKYLDIVQDSSDKLEKLIAQLFEYSKLEAKQVEPEKEPFQITDLVLDLIVNYRLIAKRKQISIEMETEKDIPLVFADISLVERAIQNIMDNAIKFTPNAGEIRLKITKNKNSVSISIEDTGPGISEEEKFYIFEQYRQSKTTERKEGAGLGLAIVRKIMELHNTNIEVINLPERGSAFQFYLPCYA